MCLDYMDFPPFLHLPFDWFILVRYSLTLVLLCATDDIGDGISELTDVVFL